MAVAHWGVRLIAGTFLASAAILVVFLLFDAGRGWTRDYLIMFVGGILIAVIPTGIGVGVLVGFIGQTLCLRTPPELPIARARIRLAVMLQACGLLTAVVNAVVATVADPRAIWLPSQVLLAVLVFAVVLFAAGKAFFYAFSVALAKAVDMQVSHRPSVAMVTLIVCGSAVIATLLSLEITEGKALSTLTEVLTAGIAYVVAVCVFGTLYVTGRYLRRLRAAVKEYNIRPADVEVESS